MTYTVKEIIPLDIIEKRITLIRRQKVMLDFHLAELYDVKAKALKRAVRRNRDRFPPDFCFELTPEEWQNLRHHFGTSSRSAWGGRRYIPYAFTEQGVAMLSSILRSKKAVMVNVEIMRAFVRLREILARHKNFARKLEEIEKKYDQQFKTVFEALRQLMAPPERPKRQIGFHVKEKRAKYSVHRK
jgi:phage regulator Rha-like protein